MFFFSFFSCFHYQGWRATGFGFEHAKLVSLFSFSTSSVVPLFFQGKKHNKMESFLKKNLIKFFFLFFLWSGMCRPGLRIFIYIFHIFFFFCSSGFPIASIHNISHASHDFLYVPMLAILLLLLLLLHDHLRCPTQS